MTDAERIREEVAKEFPALQGREHLLYHIEQYVLQEREKAMILQLEVDTDYARQRYREGFESGAKAMADKCKTVYQENGLLWPDKMNEKFYQALSELLSKKGE